MQVCCISFLLEISHSILLIAFCVFTNNSLYPLYNEYSLNLLRLSKESESFSELLLLPIVSSSVSFSSLSTFSPFRIPEIQFDSQSEKLCSDAVTV